MLFSTTPSLCDDLSRLSFNSVVHSSTLHLLVESRQIFVFVLDALHATFFPFPKFFPRCLTFFCFAVYILLCVPILSPYPPRSRHWLATPLYGPFGQESQGYRVAPSDRVASRARLALHCLRAVPYQYPPYPSILPASTTPHTAHRSPKK